MHRPGAGKPHQVAPSRTQRAVRSAVDCAGSKVEDQSRELTVSNGAQTRPSTPPHLAITRKLMA